MDPVQNIRKFTPKKGGKRKRFEFRMRITLWMVVIAGLLLVFFLPFILSIIEIQGVEEKVETSTLLTDIKDEKIDEVLVQDEKLLLTYKDGSTKTAIKEESESFTDLLIAAEIDPTKINYSVIDQTLTKAVGEILGILLPIILMAAFFFFIIRAQTKGAQDIFSFGRSKAKLFAKGKQTTTFNDVAGVEYAKN